MSKRVKNINIFVSITRILLGILFLFSGVVKLFALQEFQSSIINLGVIYDNWTPYISVLIVSVELLIGIFLLINKHIILFSKVGISLLVLFITVSLISMKNGAFYYGTKVKCID